MGCLCHAPSPTIQGLTEKEAEKEEEPQVIDDFKERVCSRPARAQATENPSSERKGGQSRHTVHPWQRSCMETPAVGRKESQFSAME